MRHDHLVASPRAQTAILHLLQLRNLGHRGGTPSGTLNLQPRNASALPAVRAWVLLEQVQPVAGSVEQCNVVSVGREFV